jgi:hypothetical protein
VKSCFDSPHCYNSGFTERTMEAERINTIANSLADLAKREAELRRYL